MKKYDVSVFYLIGAFLIFCTAFTLFIAFSEPFLSEDFTIFMTWGVILGSLSFMCLSPWKRINFLIAGILFLSAGFWMLPGLFEHRYSEVGTVTFWTIALLLVGLYFILHFFGISLFQFVKTKITYFTKVISQLIKKTVETFIQAKAVRLTAKILFWGVVIIIGLLIISGIFSWIAGLSATTIIIILLVMIYLKSKFLNNIEMITSPLNRLRKEVSEMRDQLKLGWLDLRRKEGDKYIALGLFFVLMLVIGSDEEDFAFSIVLLLFPVCLYIHHHFVPKPRLVLHEYQKILNNTELDIKERNRVRTFYLDIVKKWHPDHATDYRDFLRRNHIIALANKASREENFSELQKIASIKIGFF